MRTSSSRTNFRQCVRPNLLAAIQEKLDEQVKQSKLMFSKFATHAEHGEVSFERPRDFEGWQRPDVVGFLNDARISFVVSRFMDAPSTPALCSCQIRQPRLLERLGLLL